MLCVMLGVLLPGAASISISSGIYTDTRGRTFVAPVSHRVDALLDKGWRFFKGDLNGEPQRMDFDDAGWMKVNLPHSWNARDGQDGGNDYYRGTGWYRRHVKLDPSLRGRKLFLQFDGSNIVTEVYVNGKSVGRHMGGFGAFRFDVTESLKFGVDNLVAVMVNNAPHPDVPPLDADFTFFGGLYRHVHLLATDLLSVTSMDYGSSGVWAKQTNVRKDSADVRVTAGIHNAYPESRTATVTANIVDASGHVVLTSTSDVMIPAGSTIDVAHDMTIRNPHLWDGARDPYLYKVVVDVRDGVTPVDVVTEPLGFRFFSVDHDRGFLLNGNYLDLHGVNKHQDRLNKGWAISEGDMNEDFALMKELGVTAVRLAHYQHPGHEYDLADRYGMILWTEIPVVNRITATPAFAQNARQQLLELIRQNRNHPSVIFWGIANEVTLTPGPDPNGLLAELADLVRAEDPTRISAIASMAPDSDATSYHTEVTGFNKYFGWYYGVPDDFAAWADGIHAAPLLVTKNIGVTEFGAGSGIRFHSDTPAVNDHSEEYQSLYHETYWRAMKVRPFLWGKFIWNMFDFAVDRRKEGDDPGRNDKGLVTYDRKTRKDAFYWYKANWSDAPVVHLNSKRYSPRPIGLVKVKVYSNLDSVQLNVNGVSLGVKTGADHLFLWDDVKLVKGKNLVEAVGWKGGKRFRDSVVWTCSTDAGQEPLPR